MNWLYSALLKPFDWFFFPFGSSHPLLPLVLFSLLAGAVLLLVFKRFSDQQALQRAKDRVRAHLLEVRLFGHDAHLVWAAEKRIVLANLLYLKLLIKPLVLALPIFAWMLFGLHGWFEFRPLAPGEAVVVSAFVTRPATGEMPVPELAADEGLLLETPVLRIPAEARCDWRIRALEAGEHRLVFSAGTQRLERAVAVGAVRRSRLSRADSPGSRDAPPSGNDFRSAEPLVQMVEIDYPRARLTVIGFEIGWVTVFVVLTVVFSLVLKRPFSVTL